jgi:predicted component of type VI protein secretion system
MQTNESIYFPGMSLTVGMHAGAAAAVGLQQQRRGIRVVILSSDAPEWAMVALKPPSGPERATNDGADALAA